MRVTELAAALTWLIDVPIDRATIIDAGREIHRTSGTYQHWSNFAQAHGIGGEETSRLWSAFAADHDGPDVLDRLLRESGWDAPKPPDPWDAICRKDAVDYAAEHIIHPPVARTGIYQLDDIIGGIVAGTYTAIGGEGGAGKTAMALTIAYQAVLDGKWLPLVYSAEIGLVECWDRLLSIHTRRNRNRFGTEGLVFWANARNSADRRIGDARSWELWGAPQGIRSKAVSDYRAAYGDRDPVLVAYEDFQRLYPNRIAIRDTQITCDAICAEVRELTRAGVRVMPIIDHIHAIEPPSGTDKGEYEGITAISGALMHLAKECRCPMIALSELRNIKDGERDAPQLSWFRGSGHVGYDAGCAIVLVADGERTRDGQPIAAHVIKNRRGTRDTAHLVFSGAEQIFR